MKRIIALILVFMLLLAGCGKDTENQVTETQSTQSTQSTTTEVQNPSNQDPEEDNLGDENPSNETPGNQNPSEEKPGELGSTGNQPDNSEKTHNYQSIVTAPTCNGEGYTTHTCSECGDSYVTDITSSLGHSYNSRVTAPTCTSEGYTTYTCSVCSFSYVGDKTPSLGGHNYKVTTTEPTCGSQGVTTYLCTVCGDSYIENIESTGHKYTSVVTAPTCASEGYTTYTCSECNASYTGNKVNALGHSYTKVVTAPTCESDGYTTYTCSTCKNSYISDSVSALKHSYKTVVTAPTCTSDGYTTYTCSTCSYSYVANKVSALEHSYNKNTTAPTCENMGYTTYICAICTDTYVGDYLDALGHKWKDATTEAPKTCTTCGATEGDKLASSTTLPTLYVNYIDVGQGDSILIKVGDCDILIDAGEAHKGTTVVNYLKSKGVDDIELMINSHPHADHCGGLTSVLNSYTVEQVWASPLTATSQAYKDFAAAVKTEGLTMKNPSAGTVYRYEQLTITVIYAGAKSGDANDASLVVMLQYGSYKFLFTGDISSNIETQLVSSGANLSCDVLKVGHHGSAGSSTASFLSAVSAEYGVICTNGTSYGHPTQDALDRLASAGTSVYRTDKNGNIVFSTNGTTLTLPNGTTDSTGSGSGSSSGGSSSGGSSSGGSSSSGSSSSSTQIYIGNTETKKFHLPTCGSLPAASKQNVMYNYWWIINIAGYTPCGNCLGNSSSSTTTYIANATSKVYHVSSCSYLPTPSNRIYITSTSGYTPCGHCIK